MNRVLFRAGFVACVLYTAALQAQPASQPELPRKSPSESAVAYKNQIGRDPATWQWNIPLGLPHVAHGVVRSAAMDRDVGYNIYLPPGYAEDTKTRYPVVYYCPGASGSETSDTPVAEYVLEELEEGRIGGVIYVFMNAGHFGGYRDNPDTKVMAETYVLRELIPAIDQRYRTIASRRGRALMGFSMGGGGATRLAMKHPDMFCAVVSFAGAIDRHPDGERGADDSTPQRDNAYHWATVNQEKIREDVGLYFIVGGQDRLFPRHGPFLDHLHTLGIKYNYRVIAGLEHDLWGAMALHAGETIRFLASRYDEAKVGDASSP